MPPAHGDPWLNQVRNLQRLLDKMFDLTNDVLELTLDALWEAHHPGEERPKELRRP